MIKDTQEPNDSEYFKIEDVKNADPKKIFTDLTKNNKPNLTEDEATKFFGTDKNTIKITKNFMFGEDLALMNKLCNAYYKQIGVSSEEKLKAQSLIPKYKEKIKDHAQFLFKVKLEHDDLANKMNLKSNYLNGRMPYFATNIHTDILTDLENNKKYGWSGHISNLLYLNDDYDGGELYFPYHDIKIKPEPGMLVSFPGNWYNRHAIMPASDFRYAINIFVKVSGFPNQLEYI